MSLQTGSPKNRNPRNPRNPRPNWHC